MLDTNGHSDISDKVQLIWAPSDHKGMSWGLCEVDGEVCWFDLIDYQERTRGADLRLYQIVRLTDEQRNSEIARHTLYQEFVGEHHNYSCNRKSKATQRAERFHNRFFLQYTDNEHRQGIYDDNEVIGVFYEHRLSRKKVAVASAP